MAFYKNPQNVYRAEGLDSLEWLEHGFGTRHSPNWALPGLVMLRQVHSDICLTADGARSGIIGAGDALVSSRAGQFVGIRTADCVPILIVDERQRAVAAVHAGWRGSVKRIAARAVSALAAWLSSRPEDLLAAIGPSICVSCYEVGPDVAQQFAPWFPEFSGISEKAHVDLAETNRRQLVEAGLAPERIFTGAPCTFCHPEDFYSHRRGPHKEGRMISALGIKAR